MKSEEIQKEIDQTTARLCELNAQHSEQMAKFEAAQAAFVAGKAKLEDSLVEQQKMNLLKEAILSLEKSQESLMNDLREAAAAEDEQATLKRRAEIVGERTALGETFAKEFRESADALQETAAKLFDLQTRYGSLVREDDQLSNSKSSVFRGVAGFLKGFEHPMRESLALAIIAHGHRLEHKRSKEVGMATSRRAGERERARLEEQKRRSAEYRQEQQREAERIQKWQTQSA